MYRPTQLIYTDPSDAGAVPVGSTKDLSRVALGSGDLMDSDVAPVNAVEGRQDPEGMDVQAPTLDHMQMRQLIGRASNLFTVPRPTVSTDLTEARPTQPTRPGRNRAKT